jgi:solute carrier family 25 phosphate transporter 3
MQGFGKFGFYEIFKDVYRSAAGENEPKYRTVGFAVSSACAEVIADCMLCPMEAVSTSKIISVSFYYNTNKY